MKLKLISTGKGSQGPNTVTRRTCTEETLGTIVESILRVNPAARIEVTT